VAGQATSYLFHPCSDHNELDRHPHQRQHPRIARLPGVVRSTATGEATATSGTAEAQEEAEVTLFTLDLGTLTGWAIHLPSGHIISGTQPFKPGRYDGGGMRYLRFASWLDAIHASYPFTRVAFEEVRRHASTDAAHVHGGLLATLTAWCEKQEIPYEGIPVGTIKKHATGKGNANKLLMMQAMIDKGHNPCDDNEADALALLYYAVEILHV
jgi:Holliday junction resolvasome RuvABC endonuclease subunit